MLRDLTKSDWQELLKIPDDRIPMALILRGTRDLKTQYTRMRTLFSDGPLVAGCAGGVFLFTLLLLCVSLIDPGHVRIHPYFEKRLSSVQQSVSSGAAFLSGEALATSLEPLDDLAGEAGVAPLSEFGFADDFFGEEPRWHAAEGLKTVKVLLDSLKDQPSRVSDLKAVTKDLRKIADALEDARERSIRFCLLVRMCDATNAMEWEQRKGTAF